MPKITKRTYKKITPVKARLIREAITRANWAEPDTVLPVLKDVIAEHYKKPKTREKNLKALDMATEKDMLDTIESYVAMHEYTLFEKCYLADVEGRMIEEQIKIEAAMKKQSL